MRQSRFQVTQEKRQSIPQNRLNSKVQQKTDLKLIEYRNGIYQGLSNYQNERQGLGIYLWDGGEVYFGEWKHDKMDGQGILYFPQGGFIHGLFFKNKLNGPSFLKFANGDIYEGIWHHGKIEGKAYKYFTDEDCWVLSEYKKGEFVRLLNKGNGKPDSQIFQYLNSPNEISDKYNVNIQQLKFNDGGSYIGHIKNGLPHGLGIMKYTDGKYDCGFYSKGNLNGLCRINLHNGNIYDGFVKDGCFQGQGIFFQKQSAAWIYGLFENNQCLNVIRKGQDEFPIQVIGKIIYFFIKNVTYKYNNRKNEI